MTPPPGSRRKLFVGDVVQFTIQAPTAGSPRPGRGWRALLRTNLGRAEALRKEILDAHARGVTPAGASWRDIPMEITPDGWSLQLPVAEVGFFRAKAYLVDPRGWQHWPGGPDAGISVHPNQYRSGNTIYCAFTRLFGQPAGASGSPPGVQGEDALRAMESAGYAVLPPSGKLRDLKAQLPHIIGTLGCRILQLLPVNPTPTTYARFGRFGSPYAALDLTAVDPALVVFDRKTTGVDQFRELTYEAHRLGGRVFLDIVINHTGWGSVLQENHPEWFLRNPDGTFISPGAWGVTWEDLVELEHVNVGLWDNLSEVFLTWCKRGVDGFRCDAGYMVPVPAWQYIVARVQQEFPETIFLLEGLGGAWQATEALLTEGGMQWAYSELFQNYSGSQVASYLDHSVLESERAGLLVHYSETHDNERLAAKGRQWALLRNSLCALSSVSGGFGFTCGVEWLAKEKIRVHGRTDLHWGSKENLVPELGALNRLISEHPCFLDGGVITRLSDSNSPLCAFRRDPPPASGAFGADGKPVLVLVNLDLERAHEFELEATTFHALGSPALNLLTGRHVNAAVHRDKVRLKLEPAGALCLGSPGWTATADSGGSAAGATGYRQRRGVAAFALQAASQVLAPEALAGVDPQALEKLAEKDPEHYLGALSSFPAGQSATGLAAVLTQRQSTGAYVPVIRWSLLDRYKITLLPPAHWLVVRDSVPFRVSLQTPGGVPQHIQSTAFEFKGRSEHVAAFPPATAEGLHQLSLERYEPENHSDAGHHVEAQILRLPATPLPGTGPYRPSDIVLLTNGRGSMARMAVDFGRITSKYDCALAANLHPTLPVDRHVLVKRLRLWVNADGFLSSLDYNNLETLHPGPPACWRFVANAGDGRTVEIDVHAAMVPGHNITVFKFSRPSAASARGKQLPAKADVRLTVRADIEDRSFHGETQRNGGADYHFSAHTQPIPAGKPSTGSAAGEYSGFLFAPASDRQLRVVTNLGCYHPQAEWAEGIPHPIERSRGQTGSGDAYSPGWFEIALAKGAEATLVVSADPSADPWSLVEHQGTSAEHGQSLTVPAGQATSSGASAWDDFGERLRLAVRAFVVSRDSGKTVIAGYPWFLDWGRDTFICARGLIAAGFLEEVRQIALTFAGFENSGTLPNTIFGTDASNRDTSDAPLWFGVVCEELANTTLGNHFFREKTADGKRTIAQILESIANHYLRGTPNRIRMDPASALIWSPSHFTWMDTNYPAGTPREGYPVEIQALWIRLLRLLARLPGISQPDLFAGLAERALSSLERLFWMPEKGWYADVLTGRAGTPASEASADDALRSNVLFLVSLGLVTGERARSCVNACRDHLAIPGALRSLAPLPVRHPLPIYGNDGRLLNDPNRPYWGHYEGDEDTRRKPAYHNGTGWTWTFPVFCESLALAWDRTPEVLDAARAYLSSLSALMRTGCLGHLPENVDGDAPHQQRGCDAQAWSATEAIRVWHLLT